MEWIIIIVIVAVVLMLISGGDIFPFVAYNAESQLLTSQQYHCEEVVWLSPPRIERGRFVGKVSLKCEFEPQANGGFSMLEEHMASQVEKNSDTIHMGPKPAVFEGMESSLFDVTLKLKSDDEDVYVRGDTHIATNRFSRLRSVFLAKDFTGGRGTDYIEKLRAEVNVRLGKVSGNYETLIVQDTRVRKPFLVPSDQFVNELKERSEKQVKERAHRIVSDLAFNL